MLNPQGRERRRVREVRARTISIKRMTKRELELGRALYPETDYEKPRTRAECEGTERPCPFVSCKHHLYLDVSARTGAIKLNFPDIEPDEMRESCALDVADRGGETLEEVGAIMNFTRERTRQIEVTALARVLHSDGEVLAEMAGELGMPSKPRPGRRCLPILDEDETEDDGAGAKAAAREREDHDRLFGGGA